MMWASWADRSPGLLEKSQGKVKWGGCSFKALRGFFSLKLTGDKGSTWDSNKEWRGKWKLLLTGVLRREADPLILYKNCVPLVMTHGEKE